MKYSRLIQLTWNWNTCLSLTSVPTDRPRQLRRGGIPSTHRQLQTEWGVKRGSSGTPHLGDGAHWTPMNPWCGGRISHVSHPQALSLVLALGENSLTDWLHFPWIASQPCICLCLDTTPSTKIPSQWFILPSLFKMAVCPLLSFIFAFSSTVAFWAHKVFESLICAF